MDHRKFYIIATISAFLILSLWFYISSNSEYTMNRVLDAYTKGDYSEAQRLLDGYRYRIPEDKYHLYTAYNQRGIKDIPSSDESLKKALSATESNRNKDIRFEIYLNQTLNAYLERDFERFNQSLKNATDISPGDEWVVFLNGIQNYLKEDYKHALTNWETLPWSSNHSIWLQTAFKKAFSSNWISTRILRAQIETGDYLTSRQILEQEYQRATTEEEKINLDFLLGLTYVKEGSLKPPAAAVPYDKLSISYFNKVPLKNPPYNIEIQSVEDKFKTQAINLINSKLYGDIPFYISTLNEWGAIEELNEIRRQLFMVLKKSSEEKDWPSVKSLTVILKGSFNDSQSQEALLTFFNNYLETSAQKGDPASMLQFFEAGKVLSEDSKAIPASIRISALEDILNYVAIDSDQLNLLSPYIDFSTRLNDPQLTKELIGLAGTVWQVPGLEKKALMILEKIGSNKALTPESKNELKETLNFMYQYALLQDNPDMVLPLLQLNDRLNILEEYSTKPTEIIQRLQTIERLKNEGNLSKAYKDAQVLAKIDPKNPQVLYQAGMLAYDMGDYSLAYEILSKLNVDTPEIKSAVYVSDLLTNGEKGKVASAKAPELNRDAMLHLALGYLNMGKVEESRRWFDRILPNDDEVNAGLVTLSYMNKNWNQVLSYYMKLSPKFQRIESLQAMEIRALQKIGQDDIAQSKLLALLQAPENNDEQLSIQYSPVFAGFKESTLNDIDRNFVAGIYYLVKQNYDLSLDHFLKDTTPTAENFTNEAEIFIATKRFKDARDALLKADEISKGSLRKVIFPLMGQLFYLQGRYADAWLSFSKYFEMAPDDIENRLTFVETLFRVGRADLALAELDTIESKAGMTPETQILRIRSYVNNNEFDSALQWANKAMKGEPELPLSQQIELAKIMILPGYPNLISQVIQKAERDPSLTIEDRIHLMQLYTAQGNFQAAEKIANQYESHFSISVQGLLALAELHEALSQPVKAMEELGRAVEIEPDNYEVRYKFNKYARDAENYKKTLEFYQTDLKAEPNSLSPKIAMARTWIDMALVNIMLDKKGEDAKDLPAELHQANNLLDNLISQYTGLPNLYRLQGQALGLLKKPDQALQSFLKGISFNPSDSDSYRMASLIEEQKGNFENAETYLVKALKFDPNSPDLWRQVARVSTKRQLPLETLYALNQVIKYHPNDFEAYFNLGNINLLLKNPEGAIKAFEMVLKISPDNVDAMKSILISLHDPTLRSSALSSRDLKDRRDFIISKLKEKDPEGSAELFKKLNIEL